jgi:hypothetical protein
MAVSFGVGTVVCVVRALVCVGVVCGGVMAYDEVAVSPITCASDVDRAGTDSGAGICAEYGGVGICAEYGTDSGAGICAEYPPVV